MSDNRSIAERVASITAKKLKNCDKKISSSSSLRATESPFFDRNCRQVLGNICNFKMEIKKFQYKKRVPTIGMISSKEILRAVGDTQENKVPSSGTKSKQLSDDFLQNLLNSQNVKSMKSSGLSPISLATCKSKRKKYLGDKVSQRLMNKFKDELKKNTGLASPLFSSSKKEIFPKNLRCSNDSQSLEINEQELIHKKTDSLCNSTKLNLMENSGMSFEETKDNMLLQSRNNGYSAASATTHSEDLFDFRRELQAQRKRSDNSNLFRILPILE